MKIKLIDFGGLVPDRAHHNDAGADVFTRVRGRIGPHQARAFPLGIGVEIPDGYVGFICPRGSYAKLGFSAQMSPIDSGYRGEIHAILHNITGEPLIIKAGEKVGQLVIMPIQLPTFHYSLGKQRGEDAFGSTGNG